MIQHTQQSVSGMDYYEIYVDGNLAQTIDSNRPRLHPGISYTKAES